MKKTFKFILMSSFLALNVNVLANAEANKTALNSSPFIRNEKENIQAAESWIRLPSPSSKNTAGYLTLYNNENIDIKIIEVEAPAIAKYSEIHGYKDDEGGVKRMYPLGAVIIPARSALVFKPGSTHVMFLDLKEKLSLDKNYNVTFKIVAADEKKYPNYQLNYSVTFPVKTRN